MGFHPFAKAALLGREDQKAVQRQLVGIVIVVGGDVFAFHFLGRHPASPAQNMGDAAAAVAAEGDDWPVGRLGIMGDEHIARNIDARLALKRYLLQPVGR